MSRWTCDISSNMSMSLPAPANVQKISSAICRMSAEVFGKYQPRSMQLCNLVRCYSRERERAVWRWHVEFWGRGWWAGTAILGKSRKARTRSWPTAAPCSAALGRRSSNAGLKGSIGEGPNHDSNFSDRGSVRIPSKFSFSSDFVHKIQDFRTKIREFSQEHFNNFGRFQHLLKHRRKFEEISSNSEQNQRKEFKNNALNFFQKKGQMGKADQSGDTWREVRFGVGWVGVLTGES